MKEKLRKKAFACLFLNFFFHFFQFTKKIKKNFGNFFLFSNFHWKKIFFGSSFFFLEKFLDFFFLFRFFSAILAFFSWIALWFWNQKNSWVFFLYFCAFFWKFSKIFENFPKLSKIFKCVFDFFSFLVEI